MDTNVVVLTGRLVAATERTVGQSGRTLVELRLAVTRRKGQGETPEMVLPVTVWPATWAPPSSSCRRGRR
jgi:single-stranded DNA-binding protein